MDTIGKDPEIEKLVLWPNSVLNKKCKQVNQFDSELKELAEKMHRVMKSADGIGIAAPQIGVSKAVICIDIPAKEGKPAFTATVVNPQIIKMLCGTIEMNEGCLSFPGVLVKVTRTKCVSLLGQDLDGNNVVHELEGLAAVCAQHETDHINGITFVDHLSKLKRDILRDKILKSRQ